MEGIILIIILLGVLGWVLFPNRTEPTEKIVVVEKKEFQARQVMGYLQANGSITNNQYQQLTGLSDAQATRNLDALEKEGKIEQIGTTGKYVKYRLKS